MPELQRLFPGSRVSIERSGGREETELCAGVTAEVTGPRLSWAEAPKDAQLAHHMLFESYQRAAAIQAHCVKQMAAAAREMNNCFVDQLDGMQTRFQAAIERLDTIAFERKMMEHEASARHLSDHFRRLAADERRANAPSIAEQLANHLVAILGALATGGLPTTQKREGEHG